jgi:hypothetical protein
MKHEHDALLEAMEQQSVSIAKAGTKQMTVVVMLLLVVVVVVVLLLLLLLLLLSLVVYCICWSVVSYR